MPRRSPARATLAPRAGDLLAAAGAAAVVGGALLAYGVVVERNAFVVRRLDVPVLPPGSDPLRILHLSDLHAGVAQSRKVAFVRGLADLAPDLVVVTGDFVTFRESLPTALHALNPLLDFPGLFVLGNNDYYSPVPKSPATYFDPRRERTRGPALPHWQLRDALTDRGWLDLDNVRAEVTVAGRRVEAAGVDDTELDRADLQAVAGPCDVTADLRLALSHEPEPDVLDSFAHDGFDLVLCGHTHGGQVRLPVVGAVVTNCGIDRAHARGLFPWPDDGATWVHVSAGLGTSPYAPVRFLCPPEVTLLTLVGRGQGDEPGGTDSAMAYTGRASGM